MAVFLTILKIAGIVILSLIALVVLILAIILFVPIRYRIKADKGCESDDLYALVHFSWILHILSGKFIYDDGPDKYIKLFGIKIWPKKQKDNIDPEQESKPESKPQYTVDWNEEGPEEEEEKSEEQIEEPMEVISEETFEQTADENVEEDDLFSQIEELIEMLSAKYDSVAAKYEKIRKELRFWKKYADDEHNRIAFTYIKDRLVKVLKKIAPRKIKGLVHFGFEDPATTGKILVYLSIIYPTIPRKLRIEPSFEDEDLYGNLDIKGYIRLITPACALLQVYFNRDCRRMWRIYKKHSEKY